jgi:hypothetical protein
MYKCKKCEYETLKVSELANHYQYHHKDKNELICEKCGKKFKNEKGLKCHTKNACENNIKNKNKHICPKCKNYINNSIEKHINYCDGNGTRKNKKRRDGGQSWASGKTYIELYGKSKANEIIKKISENLVGVSKGIGGTKEKEDERKRKISEKIKERYNNGWEVKCGRCKKLEYHSEIAGDIKVDGGWELATAKYLDSIGVKWLRNKKRFKYWNSIKQKESTYCPDFFVKDWNKYIEVKGYKTDLDDIKWKQFKNNLEIWDRSKLKSLGIKAKWL